MEKAVVQQIRKRITRSKFGELMEKITNLQEQFRALDVPKG